jgi:hypothetical protein
METGVAATLVPANSFGPLPPNRFGKSLVATNSGQIIVVSEVCTTLHGATVIISEQCFGGYTGINFLDETIVLSLRGVTWTKLNTEVHVTSVSSTLVFDSFITY